MPQFIKMGLGGTGYQGRQEKTQRAARKRAARRKVFDGFPIHEPFKSIEDVREYLSGDRVICLLCGKSYKKLGGIHLQKIHGITEDQYREKYNIPWTYGLVCSATSENYRNAAKRRIKEGDFLFAIMSGEEHAKMVNKPKRKRFFEKEVALSNLGENSKPRHPLTINPEGELETFSDRRKRLTSKRGSKKFKEKMRARPQCQPEVVGKRLGDYWRGRKQTREHVRKRIAAKTQNQHRRTDA